MAATTKTWVDNNAPTLNDDDLNGFKNENNNLIAGSGQVASTADNEQTHKAVSVYASGGDFYTDSGVADAYVLSVIGAKVSPPAYFVGMRVRFVAGNANTGPATINVNSLGVKDLIDDATGAVLAANAIGATAQSEAYYDGTDFRVRESATNFAVGTHTFAALATATNGDIVISHGLASDIIDIGFKLIGTVDNVSITCLVMDANGLFNSQFALNNLTFITTVPAAPAAGNIAIRVKHASAGAQDVTVHWWARKRV